SRSQCVTITVSSDAFSLCNNSRTRSTCHDGQSTRRARLVSVSTTSVQSPCPTSTNQRRTGGMLTSMVSFIKEANSTSLVGSRQLVFGQPVLRVKPESRFVEVIQVPVNPEIGS